jgi:hypothetical protein
MPRCHDDVLARSRPKYHVARLEGRQCPCGRLYGVSADEERIHFHRAKIPSQQPHELPGLKLCPRALFARGGDLSPPTALVMFSLLRNDLGMDRPGAIEVAVLAVQSPIAPLRRSVVGIKSRCSKLIATVCDPYRPERHYMRWRPVAVDYATVQCSSVLSPPTCFWV